MGKKYSRYVAGLNGGFFEDPRWAFEIVGASIVTYKTRTEGLLWWRKKVYERSSTEKLTLDTKVRVWGRDGSSGICEVIGPWIHDDYCILEEVDEFAREIEDAISRLGS